MSNNLLIALVVVGVILVSGFAWAKHKGYGSGEGFIQHATDWMSYKLDLDQAQSAELQRLADKLRELRGDWAQEKTQMRGTVEELLAAPQLDRDRVIQLLDERHQAMAEHKGEIVDAFADFSDSLQPEQRSRLAQLIGNRMENRCGPRRWAH